MSPTTDPKARAELAAEEQRDNELTLAYEGRPLRVDSLKKNGTVQIVKFGHALVLLEDGSSAVLKFEHLGKYFGHYTIWDSSTAAATAAAALAAKAQAAEAAPLTPPSTPKRAPSSPRDVTSPAPLLLHRGAAALELSAPPWPPHRIRAATGGDRPLASCYHSPGPFEPGGADALRQGVGVEDLVLAPDTGQGCQSRRRLSYDDDGPGGGDTGREGGVEDLVLDPDPDPDRCRRRPGHPQDASLHATGAGSNLEPAPKASGHLGGTSPPATELIREPTPELTLEPTPPKKKKKRRRRPPKKKKPVGAASDVDALAAPTSSRSRTSSDASLTSSSTSASSPRKVTALSRDLNKELLDPKTKILPLFATRGDEFSPVNLSTAVHQLAKRHVPCAQDPKCTRLLAAVTSCVDADGMSMRGLATVAWGVAQLGAGPELLDAIASCVLRRLDDLGEFKAQEISNLLYAYATTGHEAPALFDVMAGYLTRSSRLHDFAPRHLTILAWSFCVADAFGPTMSDAIADALQWPNARPSEDTLAEMLEGLGLSHLETENAVLDADSAARLDSALDASSGVLDELGPREQSQLYQVLLYLQLEDSSSRLLPVLAKRRDVLKAAYVRHDARPSRSQKDVSRALDELDWKHKYEWVTAEGLSLDLAKPRQRIAIEYDGPSHYLTGDGGPPRINGTTAFKHRLLEALGWRVLHIPYYEWNEQRTWKAKKAYLRQKLGLTAPAGSSSSSGRSRGDSITSSLSSSGSSLGKDAMTTLLASIGLSDLESRLRDEAIDETTFLDLDDEDLKEIGIKKGPRHKLLTALQKAKDRTNSAPAPPPPAGGAWTCSACTEVNPDPSHVRCFLCMAPRS